MSPNDDLYPSQSQKGFGKSQQFSWGGGRGKQGGLSGPSHAEAIDLPASCPVPMPCLCLCLGMPFVCEISVVNFGLRFVEAQAFWTLFFVSNSDFLSFSILSIPNPDPLRRISQVPEVVKHLCMLEPSFLVTMEVHSNPWVAM